MKYIVISKEERTTSDEFTREFDSKEEAIKAAEADWNHYTYGEKKKNIVFVLESVNPDTEAEDHFDGDMIWTSKQAYEVDFHDFRNGATSPIDTIVETSSYTAEDYLYEIEHNGSDWEEEAEHGEFILVPIDR